MDLISEDTVSPLDFPASRVPGIRLAGDGIDVVVMAHHATSVELCLLERDEFGKPPAEQGIELFGPTHGAWHAHIPGIRAGQRYGFRAYGPWDVDAGLMYNPSKLLLDPYARGIDGAPQLCPELYAHEVNDSLASVSLEHTQDTRDSAAVMAYGVVMDDAPFDWGDDHRPEIPWDETVVYEAHVRGLTKLLPGIPDELRGTYAGLAHETTIAHLRKLGITTVELMPIHMTMSESRLTTEGLSNYWGYNTLSFFYPEPRYATAANREAGPQAVVNEVKGMIKLLHQAGIEVILDVVYNHTCEGGILGPMVSWRGLDNLVYYMHDGTVPARYADVTGCGNTLDARHSTVVAQMADSLRYWAREFHVDGFRYDLAVTLARGVDGFDALHAAPTIWRTDPELRGLKHIAEPWDVGPGGWQTGSWPAPIAAWNDQFRGDIRSCWLSSPRSQSHGNEGVGVRNLATRLSGSADLFGSADPLWDRGTGGSLNFITAHDGFTMVDLVTYEHKHNEANGEDNRDGSNDNRSWNHGIEGSMLGTSDADGVVLLRLRSVRNLLAMLSFSAGIPMFTAGDELGRTQMGNNNAYCQDNAISWLDWDLSDWQNDLIDTTSYLLKLRRENPVLRPHRFLTGTAQVPDSLPDVSWYNYSGTGITTDEWNSAGFHSFQMLRSGYETGGRDALIVINGHVDAHTFIVPKARRGEVFEKMWDSTWENPSEKDDPDLQEDDSPAFVRAGQKIDIYPLSVRVYLGTDTSRTKK